MERPLDSAPARARLDAAPAAVLLTALVCAAGAAFYVSGVVDAQEEARFRAHVTSSAEAMRDRMAAYTAMLRATRGLFEAVGGEPDPGTFRDFVDSLEVSRNYPGIQGIGWSKALHPSEREAHERRVRASGRPEYRVWPPGARPFYSSIEQLQPLDWRNRRAIGYDMFSEPARREAMERARDTGEVAISGKVHLVQEAETDRQPGFLMYLPVYGKPGASAIEERRRLLLGWVYAPFRAADLMAGTIDKRPLGTIGLAAYDGTEPRPDALLYESGPRAGETRHTRVERLEIGGRTWTLRFTATPAFASRTERNLPGGVLTAGLGIAALLFWITRADARARARAEAAARRSAFLADAGKALSASTDYEATVAEVAGLAAARVADACLVLLVDVAGPVWIAGHREAEVARRAADALRRLPAAEAGPLGVPAALATGEARVARTAPAAPRAPRGGAAEAVLRDLGARWALTVPLVARGEALGAIVLLDRRASFGEEDLALSRDLARLVAGAVDTARLYRRAQEAVAARDEFLSIASHELKTPLTSLTLHADGLRAAARRGAVDQVTRKADLIRRSLDRLTRLVSSLLDISRISAGRLDLEIEEADLAEVAREVVDGFQEEARRAGCAVVLDLEPAPGRWDRARLDQVLTNLLSNAVKYGAGKPVVVRVESRPGRALVSVQDHGIGISEADQRRIFQRFERAVSRRNYGGFGLGLWIVREIVEALGGTVRVDSVPGAGSTFTVELESGLPAEPPGSDDQRSTAPSP